MVKVRNQDTSCPLSRAAKNLPPSGDECKRCGKSIARQACTNMFKSLEGVGGLGRSATSSRCRSGASFPNGAKHCRQCRQSQRKGRPPTILRSSCSATSRRLSKSGAVADVRRDSKQEKGTRNGHVEDGLRLLGSRGSCSPQAEISQSQAPPKLRGVMSNM